MVDKGEKKERGKKKEEKGRKEGRREMREEGKKEERKFTWITLYSLDNIPLQTQRSVHFLQCP